MKVNGAKFLPLVVATVVSSQAIAQNENCPIPSAENAACSSWTFACVKTPVRNCFENNAHAQDVNWTGDLKCGNFSKSGVYVHYKYIPENKQLILTVTEKPLDFFVDCNYLKDQFQNGLENCDLSNQAGCGLMP